MFQGEYYKRVDFIIQLIYNCNVEKLHPPALMPGNVAYFLQTKWQEGCGMRFAWIQRLQMDYKQITRWNVAGEPEIENENKTRYIRVYFMSAWHTIIIRKSGHI